MASCACKQKCRPVWRYNICVFYCEPNREHSQDIAIFTPYSCEYVLQPRPLKRCAGIVAQFFSSDSNPYSHAFLITRLNFNLFVSMLTLKNESNPGRRTGTSATVAYTKVKGLISLWLYKESNKLRDWKNVLTLHIPPWAPHTYDFAVLTSLNHPRKILLVVLQIGKANDLSAPLRRPCTVSCSSFMLCFCLPSLLLCIIYFLH
jgi:hypothetical protein